MYSHHFPATDRSMILFYCEYFRSRDRTHCPSRPLSVTAKAPPVLSVFPLVGFSFPMPNAASPPQDPAGVTLTSVLTTSNSMASSAHSPPSLKSQRNQDLSLLRKSRTFRNIERDLVNKSKRLNDDKEKEEKGEKEASRRNDDQYIDKDRAIAVGAGNLDPTYVD